MKKKDIVSLIKYHVERNELGFRNEAYKIAKSFDTMGDNQIASYIMSLLSDDANTLVPQILETQSTFFEYIQPKEDPLLLPDKVVKDLIGVANAIDRHIGVNKFLFQGPPGAGKTEAAKQLAKILAREVYMVNFSTVIDSRLGQTQKNLHSLFHEINNFPHPERTIILFDEFDIIALDRVNSNDLREMGRAASELLKLLERTNEDIVLIATTNLFEHFDGAILRRFDAIIDFNQYTADDLLKVAEKFLEVYLVKMKLANRDIRLFRKIIKLANPVPMPGTLKNIIKTSLAFSDTKDGLDYMRKLYTNICCRQPDNLVLLKQEGFTIREIEILTKQSKSNVARRLKERLGGE